MMHLLGEPIIEQKLEGLAKSVNMLVMVFNNLGLQMEGLEHQVEVLTNVLKDETAESYRYWEARLQELNNLQAKYVALENGDTDLFDEASAASKKLHKEVNEKGGRALEGYNDAVNDYNKWREERQKLVQVEKVESKLITPK